MTDTEALKPCPRCDSTDIGVSSLASGTWAVDCRGGKCGLLLMRATREEAIAAWNKRAGGAEPVGPGMDAALRAALVSSHEVKEVLPTTDADLVEALRGIETFGKRHPGFGYSCAVLAREALRARGIV